MLTLLHVQYLLIRLLDSISIQPAQSLGEIGILERIELFILSLIIQFQDWFGPSPIFLPYSVTQLCIFVLSIFSCISLFFTHYFCLYLYYPFADFGLHGPYQVIYYI